jgi:hypothetical protein
MCSLNWKSLSFPNPVNLSLNELMINAMDKHTFDSLKKTSTTIYPYGSKTPLKLIGKSTLKAHVNDNLWEIEFHIIAVSRQNLAAVLGG